MGAYLPAAAGVDAGGGVVASDGSFDVAGGFHKPGIDAL